LEFEICLSTLLKALSLPKGNVELDKPGFGLGLRRGFGVYRSPMTDHLDPAD